MLKINSKLLGKIYGQHVDNLETTWRRLIELQTIQRKFGEDLKTYNLETTLRRFKKQLAENSQTIWRRFIDLQLIQR